MQPSCNVISVRAGFVPPAITAFVAFPFARIASLPVLNYCDNNHKRLQILPAIERHPRWWQRCCLLFPALVPLTTDKLQKISSTLPSLPVSFRWPCSRRVFISSFSESWALGYLLRSMLAEPRN